MTPPETTGSHPQDWEVIVIGGGFAGLSAAIYLGRALRRTLVIDSGKSLGLWEPDVQNYLGFPEGISGEELLKLGRRQAERYYVSFQHDRIQTAVRDRDGCAFKLHGDAGSYRCRRLLVATGLYHLPPEIPGVNECLGYSLFFCKDCDAYRIQGKQIAIIGQNNEAVEYALGMLPYSPCVMIALNGKPAQWDDQHAAWIKEYGIPVHEGRIKEVVHDQGQIQSLTLENGPALALDCAFTTRGDVYHNELAESLGAETDAEGQIIVDADAQTSVPGLYAAGCVTEANCQMIIAAGQGATAAQAINRSLFEESLKSHSLRRFRQQQLREEQTHPEILGFEETRV